MTLSAERLPLTTERRFAAPLILGIIADTHINPRGARRLPAEVVALFQRFNVGLILHAGDVNTLAVLTELGSVAPVIAVAGNNDDAELRGLVPEVVHFEVGALRFAMLHGHRGVSAWSEARRLAGQVDCVVYGHSHLPRIDQEGSVILFNPGSATDRRWGKHFGVGLIHVTRERIRPELVLYQDPRHLRNVAPE